jgi:hypothetical protein
LLTVRHYLNVPPVDGTERSQEKHLVIRLATKDSYGSSDAVFQITVKGPDCGRAKTKNG